MIILLLLNLPVIAFSYIVVRLYFRQLGIADRFLCAMVFYFSYIVIAEQALGLLNSLELKNLLWINLFMAPGAVFLLRRTQRQVVFGFDAQGLVEFIRKDTLRFLIISVILGFSLVKIAFNLLNAPLGWDSLNYHFPFAVEWLKHRNLDTPLVVSDNPCPSYYPLNGCLTYLWFMFPFKNVFLADIGQAPFYAIVFMSVYSICRKLAVSREYSFFASALLTLTPNYFKQLSIAYVDVMVCAWFLVALNFLLNLAKKVDSKNTIVFGISVGMLIGIKTMALTYSLILLVFFCYFVGKNKGGKGFLYLVPLVLCLVIVCGGLGYIRNFIETGNPLYPVNVKLLGKTLFKGVMDKENFTSFSKEYEYGLATLLFHEGMGVGATLFIIPGIFLLLFHWFRNKKITVEGIMLLAIFFFIYVDFRYVFSLPNVRYIYPMVGIGYAICFYALGQLRFSPKIVKWLVALCVLAALPEMARKAELVVSLLASIGAGILVWAVCTYFRRHLLRIGLAILSALIIALPAANSYYNQNEFSSYIKTVKVSGFWPDAVRAWEWLNRHTDGNAIAYIGRPIPFPLYGTNFKNEVFYVSVNKIDPVKLHYFPNGAYRWGDNFESLHTCFAADGNYRSGADFSLWWDNLMRRNAEYLFVYSLHQIKGLEFPVEDAWAKANPARFIPVFANDTIHIYKIIR